MILGGVQNFEDPQLLRMSNLHMELYRYWMSMHPSLEILPGRQHFDPENVKRLLKYIWLMDVHRNPVTFSMRLIGTSVESSGADRTLKRPMTEVHGAAWNPLQIEMEDLVRSGVPKYRLGKPYLDDHHPGVDTVERLALPLASDGVHVDMVLGMTTFNWKDGVVPPRYSRSF
jgi:hypothetical protein